MDTTQSEGRGENHTSVGPSDKSEPTGRRAVAKRGGAGTRVPNAKRRGDKRRVSLAPEVDKTSSMPPSQQPIPVSLSDNGTVVDRGTNRQRKCDVGNSRSKDIVGDGGRGEDSCDQGLVRPFADADFFVNLGSAQISERQFCGLPQMKVWAVDFSPKAKNKSAALFLRRRRTKGFGAFFLRVVHNITCFGKNKSARR